ncbi:MAG: methyltransferase, partial [Clostridiales bacterium]|nr:methyltransferase [Clostridiales bacterium]
MELFEVMKMRWQPLGAEKWIAVTDVHTFGTDAVLLANFAAVRTQDVPVDLGTGCGILPMLWYAGGYEGDVRCLDIQPSAVELVRLTAKRNGLEERLKVYELDLRRADTLFARGAFTLVTMNPPYFPSGTGAVSRDDRMRTARHESDCTLEEICSEADSLLKFGGRFCIWLRPER